MEAPAENIIPSFIVNGRPLIRGTKGWNNREEARQRAGCLLISFGSVEDSLRTNGKSSLNH